MSNLKVCTNIVIKRSGWRFLTKLTIPLPWDPEIPLVEVYSREMKIHVHAKPLRGIHSSFICSHAKPEIARATGHPYVTPPTTEKERTSGRIKHRDETQARFAKWKKPNTKYYIDSTDRTFRKGRTWGQKSVVSRVTGEERGWWQKEEDVGGRGHDKTHVWTLMDLYGLWTWLDAKNMSIDLTRRKRRRNTT